jgi:hypothetical protein
MWMNPSVSSEVLRDMDHSQEPRGNPGVDTAPQEHRSNGQTPPRNTGEPSVPDEGAFETFVDGAGI